VWAELNPRQRGYLLTIYRLDQEAEARERGSWGAGSRARPATEWRWLTYGYVSVGRGAPRGAIQRALDSEYRRDQGAGATLAALSDRGLIEERHDDISVMVQAALWFRSDTYHVSVQITRHGRAVARAGGADHSGPARTPRGKLSEWLWQVLVQVWVAGDDGVPESKRITAWRYLEERKDGPLVERRRGPARQAWGFGGIYVLTDVGRAYYHAHWAMYVRLYPQVPAPDPTGALVWPVVVDHRLGTLAAACDAIAGQLRRGVEDNELLAGGALPQLRPASPLAVASRRADDATTATTVAELAEARVLRTALEAQAAEHAAQLRALLDRQLPRLRDLYRSAAARYAGVAIAAAQAVIDHVDPTAALGAPAVDLDADGWPVDLPCPVTGLPGVDAEISEAHRTALAGPPSRPARGRRRREPVRATPVDPPAGYLCAYAGHLTGLVRGGQLQRLRVRADPS